MLTRRALPWALAALLPLPARALQVDDGRWHARAEDGALHLHDRQGGERATLPGTDLSGRLHGDAESLHFLPQRRSLLATWPALAEWWEVALDPHAPPLYEGLVHDHRLGEGLARPGYLAPRRIALPGAWTRAAFVDARVPWVGGLRAGAVVVVHLDVRRVVAEFDLPGADPAAAVLDAAAGLWHVPTAAGTVHIDTRRWRRLEPGTPRPR